MDTIYAFGPSIIGPRIDWVGCSRSFQVQAAAPDQSLTMATDSMLVSREISL